MSPAPLTYAIIFGLMTIPHTLAERRSDDGYKRAYSCQSSEDCCDVSASCMKPRGSKMAICLLRGDRPSPNKAAGCVEHEHGLTGLPPLPMLSVGQGAGSDCSANPGLCNAGQYCHVCTATRASELFDDKIPTPLPECRPLVSKGGVCSSFQRMFQCGLSQCAEGMHCMPRSGYQGYEVADAGSVCCPAVDEMVCPHGPRVDEHGCVIAKCKGKSTGRAPHSSDTTTAIPTPQPQPQPQPQPLKGLTDTTTTEEPGSFDDSISGVSAAVNGLKDTTTTDEPSSDDADSSGDDSSTTSSSISVSSTSPSSSASSVSTTIPSSTSSSLSSSSTSSATSTSSSSATSSTSTTTSTDPNSSTDTTTTDEPSSIDDSISGVSAAVNGLTDTTTTDEPSNNDDSISDVFAAAEGPSVGPATATATATTTTTKSSIPGGKAAAEGAEESNTSASEPPRSPPSDFDFLAEGSAKAADPKNIAADSNPNLELDIGADRNSQGLSVEVVMLLGAAVACVVAAVAAAAFKLSRQRQSGRPGAVNRAGTRRPSAVEAVTINWVHNSHENPLYGALSPVENGAALQPLNECSEV